MAYRYVQAHILICSNCGKGVFRAPAESDKALVDPKALDSFKKDLEKQGWLFPDQEGGPEIDFCSERCFKTFLGD